MSGNERGGAAVHREDDVDHPRGGEAGAPSYGRYFATSAASAVAAGAAVAGLAIWERVRTAVRGDSDQSFGQSLGLGGANRGLDVSSSLFEAQPSAPRDATHVTVNIDREILARPGAGTGGAIGDVMTRLNSAVGGDQWSLAEAAVERAVELAMQAVIAGDQPALRQLGGELRKLRFRMILNHKMREAPTPERIVGMLTGTSALIALAELAPPPAGARNVAEAILQTLLRKQQLSTTGLAKECGYRQETVARMLTHLRQAGLVLSVKAGRNKINSLTPNGRQRAAELIRDEEGGDGRDRTGSPELMSLRHPWNELADCHQQVRPAELLASGE